MNVVVQQKLLTISPEDLDAAYRRVFNNPDGELVLEDLKNRAFYFAPSTEAHCDTNKTMFNEGMRAMLLTIDTRLRPELKPDTGASSETPPPEEEKE